MTEAREMFEGEKGREPPEPVMDAIDNRNMETLVRSWIEVPSYSEPTTNPRDWDDRLRMVVLLAMRKAGDEALTDQVTVRLGRAFGSTKDVRAGARIVTE